MKKLLCSNKKKYTFAPQSKDTVMLLHAYVLLIVVKV